MSGRHRSKIKTVKSWTMPAGVAGSAVVVLVLTVWLSGGAPWQSVETGNAAMALAAPAPVLSSSTSPSPAPTSEPSPTPEPTPSSTPPPTSSSTPPPETKTSSKTPDAAACPTTLDGVKPHVAQVGNHVKGKFGIDDVGGAAGRSGDSDHPSGLALDFMTDETKTGNAIAEYVLANQDKFAVTYVIWRQRYNDGSGWSAMEDRGSVTANHFDHVHVSFKSSGKVSVTC
jgi:hypothetical protein